jgi:hypothetical protein
MKIIEDIITWCKSWCDEWLTMYNLNAILVICGILFILQCCREQKYDPYYDNDDIPFEVQHGIPR